ncbi:MAG: hypothetical protein A2158_01325 [Chloroflexi bacterium RBG_13_46_14]|nr:MAG: hypothetical protein A2158_01325 [Chloroflexi bacterium RBG_13_46_14]
MTVFNTLKSQKSDNLSSVRLPDIPLINKAFSPEIKSELINLKAKINDIVQPEIQEFFNLAFLGILESVSNTRKRGGFLSVEPRDVPPGRVETLFYNRIESMLSNLSSNEDGNKKSRVIVKAKQGDARNLLTKRKFDAIITSPPYPNRHDYTRIYSLEMAFDYISNNQDLKLLRYKTLRSHVEAKKQFSTNKYIKPEIVNELLNKIESNGTNNPRILSMLDGYFEDMFLVFSEMNKCLKENGQIGIIVSNVRFAGINVPVDEILSTICSQTGLVSKEIWAARYRGNSSQQMGKYKRVPSRESILIIEKTER